MRTWIKIVIVTTCLPLCLLVSLVCHALFDKLAQSFYSYLVSFF